MHSQGHSFDPPSPHIRHPLATRKLITRSPARIAFSCSCLSFYIPSGRPPRGLGHPQRTSHDAVLSRALNELEIARGLPTATFPLASLQPLEIDDWIFSSWTFARTLRLLVCRILLSRFPQCDWKTSPFFCRRKCCGTVI